MKKFFFCFFFFCISLNVEAGIFDDLKNKIVPESPYKKQEDAYKKEQEEAKQKKQRNKEAEVQKKLELNTIAEEFNKVIIKPFGDLEWDNTIYEVVQKLNKIDGIEEIGIFDTYGIFIDLKGASLNDLKTKLQDLIEGKYQSHKRKYRSLPKVGDKDYEFKRKNFLSSQSFKLINIDGKDLIYNATNTSMQIVAFPLNIKGIPFRLEVKFYYNPGVAIAKPNDLIIVSDIFAFPLAIEKISLKSDYKGSYQEINKIFNDRYGKFNDIQINKRHPIRMDWSQGVCDISDAQGNQLFISTPGNRNVGVYDISYYPNINYSKELGNLYTKHLAERQAGNVKGKKDASGGL
jgi:hypothetical protein